jgi:hypothetical protein
MDQFCEIRLAVGIPHSREMRIPKEYSELCISCRLLTIYRKLYELDTTLTSCSRGERTN